MAERLPGGRDTGAVLVDGTVRRPVRTWTSSVHDLLQHLERAGFDGAPRVLGVDAEGREMLRLLPGETVGDARPWPAWTHSEAALVDVAHWLRHYHHAVSTYRPPTGATWRAGAEWRPGLVIGHGDPAPYNAVWSDGLVGLIDFDDAGPVTVTNDVAWTAFAWAPLHAPDVVRAEGFTDLGDRRRRLGLFLDAYGWAGTVEDALAAVDARLVEQVATIHALAAAGDPAYRAALDRGQHRQLEAARAGLADV